MKKCDLCRIKSKLTRTFVLRGTKGFGVTAGLCKDCKKAIDIRDKPLHDKWNKEREETERIRQIEWLAQRTKLIGY